MVKIYLNFLLLKKVLFVAILFFFSSIFTYAQESWSPTSVGSNVPLDRSFNTAVWTGSKMIVWAGFNYVSGSINTGGIYDPLTDTWTATSTSGVPSVRYWHTAVWTGSVLGGKMIVWGGVAGTNLNTGGIYNPLTDTWIATSTSGAPAGRREHTAVWTGSKMIVWGGGTGGSYLNTGGIYDPVTDTWTATSTSGAPSIRSNHTAVWTGSKMIVWGGATASTYLNTGGIYDPVTDTWTATSLSNAPSVRHYQTVVWTGSKMIVWGGSGPGILNTGGIYDPVTDTWTATSTSGAPSARNQHTAVWTGSPTEGKMIVWGGNNGSYLNTGGIYDPLTDAWTATTSSGVPSGRLGCTAVWTGSSMIVWGGIIGVNNLTTNTGGVYTNAGLVGIIKNGNTVPNGFSLSQNYPNPFNPSTTIHFQVPGTNGSLKSFVKLTVYNINGKEAATLINKSLDPGNYEVEWDAASFALGIYFYTIKSGEFTDTKKMILLK